MGEMADFCNDQMQDAYPDWLPPGNGTRASPRYRPSVYGPPLVCKHCGSADVYWQSVKGQHKLYDKTNLTPHICNKHNMNTEGFDDVD